MSMHPSRGRIRNGIQGSRSETGGSGRWWLWIWLKGSIVCLCSYLSSLSRLVSWTLNLCFWKTPLDEAVGMMNIYLWVCMNLFLWYFGLSICGLSVWVIAEWGVHLIIALCIFLCICMFASLCRMLGLTYTGKKGEIDEVVELLKTWVTQQWQETQKLK